MALVLKTRRKFNHMSKPNYLNNFKLDLNSLPTGSTGSFFGATEFGSFDVFRVDRIDRVLLGVNDDDDDDDDSFETIGVAIAVVDAELVAPTVVGVVVTVAAVLVLLLASSFTLASTFTTDDDVTDVLPLVVLAVLLLAFVFVVDGDEDGIGLVEETLFLLLRKRIHFRLN